MNGYGAETRTVRRHFKKTGLFCEGCSDNDQIPTTLVLSCLLSAHLCSSFICSAGRNYQRGAKAIEATFTSI